MANGRLLTVYLAAGALGTVNVDLRGALPRNGSEAVGNPRFVVRDVTQQSGYIVVQVDPSVELTADQLENIEEVGLGRVASWLTVEQRPLSRLIMFHRTVDYRVRFLVTPRQPRVNAFSVTNIRITPREIEELVFLKFTVRNAGIREVSFLLPASLRDSEISVPLLRQKTITPVEGDSSRVRVRLELQDHVIDELIVLVLNSRSLTSSAYSAPVPAIETGTTDFRYVVIESAGRDEVVITKSEGFLELNRQLSQWKRLAQTLPGNITQAYVAREATEDLQLTIATRQRAAVETAGAGIGLAQTLLMVDANGAYRGMQEYRVDNKTEQFLEIELPEGAQLWTVFVAGEAVKPTEVPNSATGGRVRVPLIKTQTGDLDYSVKLTYGGDLRRLRSLRHVRFPLMKTININVQQSHVRLRLPESQRWFNFAGSMRQVTDVGELAADYVSYQTKQVQRLMQVINSDAYDAFSRVRAENNIKLQVQNSEAENQKLVEGLYGASSNRRLQSELQSNSGVVLEAEKQIQQQAQSQPDASQLGNSYRFRQLYKDQGTNRASDVVSGLDNNFNGTPSEQEKEITAGEQRFNEAWFFSNQLKTSEDKKEDVSGSRIAARPSKARAAKPGLGTEAELLKNQGKALEPSEEQGKKIAVDEVSQIERYQRRLEVMNDAKQLGLSRQTVPQSASAASQTPEYSDSFRDRESQLEMAGRAEGRGGGFGGGRFGRAMYGGAEWMDAGVQATPGVPESAGETGFASLDVTLPERGAEYLFTTPRGDIEITAQSVSTDQVDRVMSLLSILAVLIGLAVVYRIGWAIVEKTSKRTLAITSILLGVLSIVVGVLPVVGIVMTVWGIATAIRASVNATPAASS